MYFSVSFNLKKKNCNGDVILNSIFIVFLRNFEKFRRILSFSIIDIVKAKRL